MTRTTTAQLRTARATRIPRQRTSTRPPSEAAVTEAVRLQRRCSAGNGTSAEAVAAQAIMARFARYGTRENPK